MLLWVNYVMMLGHECSKVSLSWEMILCRSSRYVSNTPSVCDALEDDDEAQRKIVARNVGQQRPYLIIASRGKHARHALNIANN